VANHTSPTFDEPDHLAIGYNYLPGFLPKDGPPADPRAFYNNMNLRLSHLWAALPLLPLHPHFPTPEEQAAGGASGINYGRLFVFKSGASPEAILGRSRAMIVLLGVALGVALFLWSRRLHGDAAGLVTLAFCCLSPMVIANSAIATTDIATTLLFTLALLTLWRLLHRVSVLNLLLAGLAVGALASTKISGLLITPVAGLLLLIRLLGQRPLETKLPLNAPASRPFSWGVALRCVGALLGAALLAWAVVWGVYGFHYQAMGTPIPDANWALPDTVKAGLGGKLVALFREWRLLPEAYLFDLKMFAAQGSIRRAFLFSEYSVDGWWYFFPVAWLVKNPLPFMLGLVGALAAAWRLRRARAAEGGVDWYGLAPLLALGAVYGAATLTSKLNIGARHLLPLYPLLLVFAGLLARLALPGRRTRATLLSVLLGWSAFEVWAVHPHYLAYFNELAGGPANGHKILVDSSYEWGEDLPFVQQWLARRAAGPDAQKPVYFSYFGCADLAHYGIRPMGGPDGNVVLLPQYFEARPLWPPNALGAGTYVISATMLKSLYNGYYVGPWRPSYEAEYEQLYKEMKTFEDALKEQARLSSLFLQTGTQYWDQVVKIQATDAGKAAISAIAQRHGGFENVQALMRDPAKLNELLFQEGHYYWAVRIRSYDYLRFSRLCAHLRQREPDSRISYGMLVYELGEEELVNALDPNLKPTELNTAKPVKGTEKLTQDQIDFLK
jgi:hypothetical protein